MNDNLAKADINFDTNLDKIFITDFLVNMTIGITEEERKAPRDVLLNITLWIDANTANKAALTDDLNDTVDYRQLHDEILDLIAKRTFVLIETFAEEIVQLAFQHPLVQKIQVRVEKPGILKQSKSAGLEITRTKGK